MRALVVRDLTPEMYSNQSPPGKAPGGMAAFFAQILVFFGRVYQSSGAPGQNPIPPREAVPEARWYGSGLMIHAAASGRQSPT